MLLDDVRSSLARTCDPKLVDELLEAYVEAKRNFYLGGLRLSAVAGGRFCEAALRMLQQETTGKFDPLGRQLKAEALIAGLANIPAGSLPDSVRLHIPRALRLVYDIRNKRDAAHLADGIDPNQQDATVVVSVLDWVLAEFIRLHHGVSASAAQRMVDELVTRQVPAIQMFGDHPKVLRSDLGVTDYVLLLLYQAGVRGATYEDLERWVRPGMRANLRRTLRRAEDEHALIHRDEDSGRHFITHKGMRDVEAKRLLEPA